MSKETKNTNEINRETIAKARSYINPIDSSSAIVASFDKVEKSTYNDEQYSYFEFNLSTELLALNSTISDEFNFPICKFPIPNAEMARWISDQFAQIAMAMEKDARTGEHKYMDMNESVRKNCKFNILK